MFCASANLLAMGLAYNLEPGAAPGGGGGAAEGVGTAAAGDGVGGGGVAAAGAGAGAEGAESAADKMIK